MINLSSNDILTNINLKIENNIIKKFNENLINKFRMIEQNINTISSYLKNIGLTIKLYNEQYYIQLSNTYNLLKKIFDVKKINQKTVKLLKKHSKKTENKLSIQSSYIHKYRILSDTKQIKIKNIKLTDQQFNELFYVLDYLKLYDIIFGDFKINKIVNSILSIDKKLSSGKYQKYPNQSWINKTSGSILQFGKLAINVDKEFKLSNLLFGIMKMNLIVDSITSIDKKIGLGKYQKYPNQSWINKTSSSILQFILNFFI
jgi:hypothetical protein